MIKDGGLSPHFIENLLDRSAGSWYNIIMKNNEISLFIEGCYAIRIDTQEIIASGSRFYCECIREGNGGTPAVDPENVVIMTHQNYEDLQVVQESHVGNP